MKLRINAVQQLGGILGQYEDAAQCFHGIPVRIVTWSFRHLLSELLWSISLYDVILALINQSHQTLLHSPHQASQ